MLQIITARATKCVCQVQVQRDITRAIALLGKEFAWKAGAE